MRTSILNIRKVGRGTRVAVLVCAVGAISCSRGSSNSGRAPDGAVRDSVAAGGDARETTGSTGLPGTGGASGGLSETKASTSAGGATGSGSASLAGQMAGVGGTSAAQGGSASLPKGGVERSSSDIRASSGTSSADAAGMGGSSPMTSGTGGSASGGNASTGSRTDAGVIMTPDASARSDGRVTDVLTYADFGRLIDGTWLVGWSDGDTRHYSWVRLSGSWGGTAEYLSGANLPSNTPLWACSGQDSWFLTEAYYSIMLRFPSSCPSGLPSLFTFRGEPDPEAAPAGATFGMVAPSTSSVQPTTQWWRFPDDQCDATMSACKSPF